MTPTCGVCGSPLTDDWATPPTWSMEEVEPGKVRPVLSKPLRVDPESGAVCWCAPVGDRSGRVASGVGDTGGPMSEIERREPVLLGSVLPARPAKVTVTVELDNVLHSDCGRYVSEHVPGDGHYCDDPLEAAGWPPPGNCAGGCR